MMNADKNMQKLDAKRALVSDFHLLEGPHSRTNEFLMLLRLSINYLRGLRALHFVGPCVTVFGSARTPEGDGDYDLAKRMGGAIAHLGFTVMTGGGPGIMEAANRGAREVGGRSVGCNIRLPVEQRPNPYLDKSVTMQFFSIRKTLLIKYSYAFVVFPGGFGTLDEFFEALTLIQTGKLRNFPVVLMGVDYWRELIEMLQKMTLLGMIDARDLGLVFMTNSVEDAASHIQENAIKPFGLVPAVRQHFPWLLERGMLRASRFARNQMPA